ncbi:hypothetical protein [Synechococcus sp. PCC 7336]|uniref:hypothetical protein n=1 Tax=Synechococcus sp. PCC 7336 TaxID=195250 RepID=UPI0003744DE0|nr:hypothetical protein [Synechococcus sp. PCC 7336]
MSRKLSWLAGSVSLLAIVAGISWSEAVAQTPSGSSSLLESTRAASDLIPPLDVEIETDRALSSAGREDPFVPLNTPSTSTSDLPFELPPLPPIDDVAAEPADPAAFSRGIRVKGLIQIGNDTFAVLEADGVVSEVVRAGDRFESARVASISVNSRQVVFEEGGETIVASVVQ